MCVCVRACVLVEVVCPLGLFSLARSLFCHYLFISLYSLFASPLPSALLKLCWPCHALPCPAIIPSFITFYLPFFFSFLLSVSFSRPSPIYLSTSRAVSEIVRLYLPTARTLSWIRTCVHTHARARVRCLFLSLSLSFFLSFFLCFCEETVCVSILACSIHCPPGAGVRPIEVAQPARGHCCSEVRTCGVGHDAMPDARTAARTVRRAS